MKTYIHTYIQIRTESLSIRRIGGAGSHWWYMTEVRKRWKNKKF